MCQYHRRSSSVTRQNEGIKQSRNRKTKRFLSGKKALLQKAYTKIYLHGNRLPKKRYEAVFNSTLTTFLYVLAPWRNVSGRQLLGIFRKHPTIENDSVIATCKAFHISINAWKFTISFITLSRPHTTTTFACHMVFFSWVHAHFMFRKHNNRRG